MRGVPWTDPEIEAVRAWVATGNPSDYKAVVAAVIAINPIRPIPSIRNLATRLIRTARPLTEARRKRMEDKWSAVTKRYGNLTEPSAVCWNVSAFRSIPIGLALFVKYSIVIGRLPIGSNWKDFIPKTKKCPRCGLEKSMGVFGYNPAACDGLSYYCSSCTVGGTTNWRKSKRIFP